jgi:hypothetical protein
MCTLAICIPIHALFVIGILILLIVLSVPDIKEHIVNIKQIFKKS